MTDVVDTRIKAFGLLPKAGFVPQSEDPVFILTGRQLQDVITRALQPLQDEVENLRATVTRQDEKIAALESTQEHDVNRICLDICQDRQRLARLEKVEPQPLQKDRGDILRALLAANGGKMLAKDARAKMHLRKDLFSQMLRGCDFLDVKPLHSDKRKMVIILRSELV